MTPERAREIYDDHVRRREARVNHAGHALHSPPSQLMVEMILAAVAEETEEIQSRWAVGPIAKMIRKKDEELTKLRAEAERLKEADDES